METWGLPQVSFFLALLGLLGRGGRGGFKDSWLILVLSAIVAQEASYLVNLVSAGFTHLRRTVLLRWSEAVCGLEAHLTLFCHTVSSCKCFPRLVDPIPHLFVLSSQTFGLAFLCLKMQHLTGLEQMCYYVRVGENTTKDIGGRQ